MREDPAAISSRTGNGTAAGKITEQKNGILPGTVFLAHDGFFYI